MRDIMIELQKINDNDLSIILDMIYSDVKLEDTFGGNRNTQSRIVNSIYSAIIYNDDESIGFIMFVNNDKTSEIEIDMGLLSQYRNKGYGTQALCLLKQIIKNNNIDVRIQVNNDNISAIKTVEKNGFSIVEENENFKFYK